MTAKRTMSCDPVSGRRRTSPQDAHAIRMKNQERGLLSIEPLGPIARRARKQGLPVSCIFQRTKGHSTVSYTKRSSLIINGHSCLISTMTSTDRERYRSTPSHMTLRAIDLQGVEIVIFRTAVKGFPERIFIVPKERLQRTHRPNGSQSLLVCIPLALDTPQQRLDLWAYEDAWHLLKI